jgi:hypothetical protein
VIVSLEKPGTPSELVHFGIKGMKWGIRKERVSSGQGTVTKKPLLTDKQKATAKKVAIGVGVLTVAAGTAYVAYKLHQNGNLPISSLRKSTKSEATVKKIVEETDLIHLSRGKTKSLQFFKQGGTPNYFSVWENALGKHAHSSERSIFDRQPNGSIAARFLDPLKRFDQSGRPILHEVIIPKSMTEGINNHEDVVKKIWPLLKDTYSHE